MILRSVDVSLIDALWFVLSLCFLAAFFLHKISSCFPGEHGAFRLFLLFQDLIRYGKTKQGIRREDWLRAFDVPKRWFLHFYAVSVAWNGFILLLYLNLTVQHQSLPRWLSWTVDMLTGGSNADIHGTGPLLSQLDWFHVAGIILFILASGLQHQSMVLLAKLRTGKSGAVETLAHRVPTGGWFELVSCPHYFAELLIYISLNIVFGFSLTWGLVVLYVLFNQALAAQLCHDLYIRKYESYPKCRKAFIPFIL